MVATGGGWSWVRALVLLAACLVMVGCAGGSGSDDKIATQQPPVIQSVTPEAVKVVSGQSVSFVATFSGGTGVLNPGGLVIQSGVPVVLAPLVTTVYTLTVQGAGGVVTRTFTIEVIPLNISLIANPPVVTVGGGVNLTVHFAKGTAVLNPGIGPVLDGAVVSYLTQPSDAGKTLTFSLVVTEDAATPPVTVDVLVPVVRPPRINYFVLE